MEEITYDNVKILVPESYDDITLGDYETYYKMKRDTIESNIEFVAAVLKIDAAQLLAWPIDIYHIATKKLSFLNNDNPFEPSSSLQIDGVTYFIDVEEKQSLGAWVDVEEAQRGNAVLSEVLSILCRPAGEPYNTEKAEERQKIFARQPLSKVLPALGFFLQCSETLEASIKAFTRIDQVVSQLPKGVKDFWKLTGGIKLSTIWLAVRYYVLTQSLNYHLRKLSRTYNSVPTSK